MIVFYPVAFVVLAQATVSDRCDGSGSDRITPLSLMSRSLEPRTWGGCGYRHVCNRTFRRLPGIKARAISATRDDRAEPHRATARARPRAL